MDVTEANGSEPAKKERKKELTEEEKLEARKALALELIKANDKQDWKNINDYFQKKGMSSEEARMSALDVRTRGLTGYLRSVGFENNDIQEVVKNVPPLE